MDGLLNVTVIFALALALALLVERLLEILMAVFNLLDSRFDWHRFWTRRTLRLKTILEKRLNMFEYVSPEQAAGVLQKARKLLLNSQEGAAGSVPVLSGDLVRAASVKVIFKFIGVAVGIGLALWLRVDLVQIWQAASEPGSRMSHAVESPLYRTILTGIMIGLGAGPMHKIITTMEKRRADREQKGA